MGLSTSVCNADDRGVDHVDAETFPLKLLLNEAGWNIPRKFQWRFYVKQMGKS